MEREHDAIGPVFSWGLVFLLPAMVEIKIDYESEATPVEDAYQPDALKRVLLLHTKLLIPDDHPHLWLYDESALSSLHFYAAAYAYELIEDFVRVERQIILRERPAQATDIGLYCYCSSIKGPVTFPTSLINHYKYRYEKARSLMDTWNKTGSYHVPEGAASTLYDDRAAQSISRWFRRADPTMHVTMNWNS